MRRFRTQRRPLCRGMGYYTVVDRLRRVNGASAVVHQSIPRIFGENRHPVYDVATLLESKSASYIKYSLTGRLTNWNLGGPRPA
jgi:hypothetical protein